MDFHNYATLALNIAMNGARHTDYSTIIIHKYNSNVNITNLFLNLRFQKLGD